MSGVDQLKPVFSGTVSAICHLAVGDVYGWLAQANSKLTKHVGKPPASDVNVDQ
jgi:hypothetical protein